MLNILIRVYSLTTFPREEGPSDGTADRNHVFSEKEKVTKLKLIYETLKLPSFRK